MRGFKISKDNYPFWIHWNLESGNILIFGDYATFLVCFQEPGASISNSHKVKLLSIRYFYEFQIFLRKFNDKNFFPRNFRNIKSY